MPRLRLGTRVFVSGDSEHSKDDTHYMDSAFRTYTDVGNDAQIKTNADQKRQLPNWKPEWE